MAAKRKLTKRERYSAFAINYAETGNAEEAARKTGMHPLSGHRLVKDQAVIAQSYSWLAHVVATETVPIAARQHVDMLLDPKTPAATKANLIKLAYDQLGIMRNSAASGGKDLSEMSADELEAARTVLLTELADRARPVVDQAPIEPADQAEPGLFD